VTGSTRLALLLLDPGYPQAALRKGREAVSLGRKLAHPYSWCFALAYLGKLHSERGKYLLAEQLQAEATTLADQHGLVFMATLGSIWRDWALIGQGLYQDGVQLIEGGHDRLSNELPGDERLYQKYLSAAAYQRLRRSTEALALVGELFDSSSRPESGIWKEISIGSPAIYCCWKMRRMTAALNNRFVMRSRWRAANERKPANCALP